MASALGSFVKGFLRPLSALRFVLTHRGIKRYLFLPTLLASTLYLVILLAAIYGIRNWDWGYQFDFLGAYLGAMTSSLLNLFKWLLLLPMMALTSYFTFTTVGMTLASPFNDLLSEKIERVLCVSHEPREVPFGRWLRATARSLRDSAWIALKQLCCCLLTLPFLMVPVIGFLPLLLVNAYFTGRGCLEVGTARNFLDARHTREALKLYRWELLGLGLALEFLFLLPFVGLLILPLGIVAGTQLYCEIPWLSLLQRQQLTPPLGFFPPVPAASHN